MLHNKKPHIMCPSCGKDYEPLIIDNHISQIPVCEICWIDFLNESEKELKNA